MPLCLHNFCRSNGFQHVNDPKHAAKMTTAFFQRNMVKFHFQPSNSSGLSPMYHTWGVLRKEVDQKQPMTNIISEELLQIALEEWKMIKNEVFHM